MLPLAPKAPLSPKLLLFLTWPLPVIYIHLQLLLSCWRPLLWDFFTFTTVAHDILDAHALRLSLLLVLEALLVLEGLSLVEALYFILHTAALLVLCIEGLATGLLLPPSSWC
jgi:hypothetical protein